MSTTAPAPTARLRLLGGFELSTPAGRLPASASAQRVLAYLAVHGRAHPVPRRAVAERLWATTTSGRAASSLRSALWRLPRPDGKDLVESTATTMALAPHVEVDLWRGEDDARVISTGACPGELPEVGRFAELTDDLLPDWSEEWLLVEQESYRQARLHALEKLSVDLREAGRHHAALEAGLAAVRCEPLRESAHRRVIEVHLAEGNHSEALRQYQAFRRLLADELGLPPSSAIRQLVQHLLGRPVERATAAPAAPAAPGR